jgi:small-conductance mechanosensitive channel
MADEIKDTQVEPAQTESAEKTFTQAEVDAILKNRLSRVEKETAKKIEEAKTEAERLATMSAEEKAIAKQKADEAALTAREQGITRRELRAEALQQLAEKGLPKELAEVLPYTDADTTNAAITAVESAFRKAVEIGVNERLKGNPPKIGQDGKTKSEKEKLIEQYNAAEKRGDIKLMFALEAQIRKLKE